MSQLSNLAVPAMETVVAKGQAHIVVSERQGSPTIRESLLVCAGCTLFGLLLTRIALGLFIPFMFVPIIAGAVFVTLSRHRAIGVVAFPDYFVVLRSNAQKIGKLVHWSELKGAGTVIAILERFETLRPEERVPSPGIREIVAFSDGRLSVLVSGRLTEDEGIETLHKLRGFFERHTRSDGTSVSFAGHQGVGAATAEGPRPPKGTLQ